MTLWRILRCYTGNQMYYDVLPYDLVGHLKNCVKWYGLDGLKDTYLSHRRARRIANRKNRRLQNELS